MKGKILAVVRVGLSLAFLCLLAWMARKDFPAILKTLKSANICLFSVALLLNVAAISTVAVRLKKILSLQGLNVSLKEALYLNFIGLFFNNFLPTSVGGDLVKAYYTSKKTDKKLESFSAVFFDRFFGFLSIGLLALLGIVFLNKNIKDKSLLWGSGVFLAAVSLAFIVFLNKDLAKRLFSGFTALPVLKEGSKLRRLYNTINAYKKHKGVIVNLISISLAAQMVYALAVYFVIRSLSQEISLLHLFLIIPLVSAASMMPSINGLGVREGAYVYFFSEFISKEGAFAASILTLAVISITSFIGGIMYLFSNKIYMRGMKKSPAL